MPVPGPDRRPFAETGFELPGADPAFQPTREGPVFGIDLGTTNTCVAVIEGGAPTVLSGEKGERSIDSLVSVTENGTVLVGKDASHRLQSHPASTVNESKRLVGAPAWGKLADLMRDRVMYEICEGQQGEASVLLQGRLVALEEIAALILLKAKQTASVHYGREVHRAVITCPAAYNELQRAAVRKAGHLAGLCVERVINEPTAAAVAYGYRRDLDKKLAIFDLGGGTFDATVLHMKASTFEVLATGGDTFLGGADFDGEIVAYLLHRFEENNGVPMTGGLEALARVRQAAVNAKHVLSNQSEAPIRLPMLMYSDDAGPLDLDVLLTNVEVDTLIAPLIERCIQGMNAVIRSKGLKPADIDDVLLVGGMTRVPAVQRRLRKYFGRPPSTGIDPDEAVARGAAVVAGSIMDPGSQLRLKDVLSKSIGVADPRYGEYEKLIERNKPLPMASTYVARTTYHNQTSLPLHVFQGDDRALDDNEFLGTLTFSGLPKRKLGECKVEVHFTVTGESMLEIEAHEMTTGQQMKATLSLEGGVPEAKKPTSREIMLEGQRAPSLWDWLMKPFRR